MKSGAILPVRKWISASQDKPAGKYAWCYGSKKDQRRQPVGTWTEGADPKSLLKKCWLKKTSRWISLK